MTTDAMEDDGRRRQLSKCLDLLSPGRKDEEKFVGLLMIPKLVNPETDKDAFRMCFEHMDWNFVDRLLTSEGTEEMPGDTLKGLALNIIQVFGSEADFRNRPELTSRIPSLAKLLDSRDMSEFKRPVMECLYFFADSEEGATQLQDLDTLRRIYSAMSDGPEDASVVAFHLFEQLYRTVHSRGEFFNDANTAFREGFLDMIATTFATVDTHLKFECGRLLMEIFADHDLKPMNGPVSNWALELRKGIMTILTSKIGSQQRDMALMLSSALCRQYGARWILQGPGNSKGKAREGSAVDLSPAQTATILIHLAGGELRLLLDDAPTSEIPDPASRACQIVPICAEIVETLIRGLIGESEEASVSLPLETVESIRQSLHETMESVRAYLIDVQIHCDYVKNVHSLDTLVTASCLRLLATWLAEDDTMSTKEIRQVVPVLVSAGRIRLECLNLHPIQFLGPALLNITADPAIRDAFISSGGCRMLIDVWSSQSGPSPFSLSIVGTLLNVVATKDEVVKSDDQIVRSLDLFGRDVEGLDPAAKTTTDEDLQLVAHYVAYALIVCRSLSPNQLKGAQHLAKGIIDVSAKFLLRGLELEGGKSKAGWEELKELWLISCSAFTACTRPIPKDHEIRRLESVQALQKLSQKSGILDPEAREALGHWHELFLAK
ncbi:Neurochondrin-domain-containing protein [Fimicolochytrium jonesii]|uniref:Neurochondrin-domain-containing protein n=1 Tax=Fimicolochytrium jonesii TaxID=1396493 RepID=UPI0022FE0149|nr:Neurochondrin-domain-containing protein [Fimicolochytrium jonesii]KAI8825736.1 Neurochondrin-domain-containing protein [Fimicolochytrium jonesii]